MLEVSIVYLAPGTAWSRQLRLLPGATVGDAVQASGLLDEHAELRGVRLDAGVFSRPCSLDQALRDGDRVEVYRPLTVDPKEARRIRAAIRRRRQQT